MMKRRPLPAAGLFAAALLFKPPAWSSDTDRLIDEAASSVGLNPALLGCLFEHESRRNPHALNVEGRGYFPRGQRQARQVLAGLDRKLRLRLAYPWLIRDGRGLMQRFGTETEARQFARENRLPANSVRWDAPSIDVGLAQINWYWHGRRFDRLEDLFEPRLNAHYGAHYLRQLIDRHGLSAGLGRYHSQKSPQRREHYRSLVAACLQSIGGIDHAVE